MLIVNKDIDVYCSYVPEDREFPSCTFTRRYLEDETVKNTIYNMSKLSVMFLIILKAFCFKTSYYVVISVKRCKNIDFHLEGKL